MLLPHLSFKAYCSCACTHPFIEAGAVLRDRVQEIESISVKIQTMIDGIVGNGNENIYAPRNIEELQYSLPVQMALAATGKGNGYRTHLDFMEGRLQLPPDSDVIQLAQLIKLEASKELDDKYGMRFVADVSVRYKDGSTQYVFIDKVPGRAEMPYTPEQHRAKLDELTIEVIGAERSDQLFAMIERFDANLAVTELTALLH